MKRIMLSIIACLMLMIVCVGLVTPVMALGTAPVAENMELNTFRNASVSGMLSAYDPEGDVVSFDITTKPVKGNIVLEQNGSFVYTPDENKKGRDYFGYKAIDSQGNLSQEATVIIRIDKNKKAIEYTDMENRAGEYASLKLCEKEIFVGEKIGECYYFSPDKDLSRTEFLRMCSLVSGKESMEEDLPQKEQGSISKNDAVLILNDVLGLENVNYINFTLDGEHEFVQACMNLNSVDVIREALSAEDNLSREEAAIMLVKAIEIIENR